MDIDDSYLFVKISDTLSFKHAASQLGISRSSASKRIALLEKEVGVTLLNRSPRSIGLTPAGMTFLQYCKSICESMDEARAALASEDKDPRGRLRFRMASSLGSALMPSIVDEFLPAYPMITLDADFGEGHADMIGGGYDVAIQIARRLPDSALMAKRLATTPQVLAASPIYLEKHAALERVQDLQEHACLGVSSGMRRSVSWAFTGEEEALNVTVTYAFTANSDLAVNLAARSGMGFICSPEISIRNDLRDGSLVSVLPENCRGLDFGVYALYPNKNLPAKAKSFIEFVQEKLSYWTGERRV